MGEQANNVLARHRDAGNEKRADDRFQGIAHRPKSEPSASFSSGHNARQLPRRMWGIVAMATAAWGIAIALGYILLA